MKLQHTYRKLFAAILCFTVLFAFTACQQSAENNSGASDGPVDNSGKYVSILGDSISTYEGISNVGSVNTSIEGYNAFYNGDWKNALTSSEETYWGSVISRHDMKLLVNSSSGGNRLIDTSGAGVAVDPGYIRVENLAANTGQLKGTKPDMIFIYMGTNDCNAYIYLGELTEDTYTGVISDDGYIIPSTFTEAYIITLEKALNLYPDAQIFVFTLLPSSYNTDWEFLHSYNTRIREIADHYDEVVLVDIAQKSGITTDNYTSFTLDGTHPNKAGMLKIATILDWAISNNP